jgi:hypothetical protein
MGGGFAPGDEVFVRMLSGRGRMTAKYAFVPALQLQNDLLLLG